MKFLKAPLAASTFILLMFSACTKKNGDDDTGNGNTPGPLFTGAKAVLQANCVNCHGASNPAGSINLTDDAQILAKKARIKLRAVDQAGTPSQMPPPPMQPLSAADQKKITDWVSAGGELTD